MTNGTNGANRNGYVKRTRFKVAKLAIGLIFVLTIVGIVLGVTIPALLPIVGNAITAGITGIGTVAGVYIGGDSYRSSYPSIEPNNSIVIQQGGLNQSEINQNQMQQGYPPTSEAPLPPAPYLER